MSDENGLQGHHQRQRLPRPVVVGLLIFCVLLSLSACAVTIGNPGASSTTTSGGISEHVQVAQDQSGSTLVLAPVKIHGQGPFTFAVDTGASTSLISTAVAKQLNLTVAGGAEPITGVGGVTQSVPVDISNWSTGDIRLPAITIASATIPHERGGQNFDGLLGSDIWSQFGKFTLDYDSGTLTVYKQIAVVPFDRRLVLSWLGI
jgi:predicted aspartyl protease